MTWITGFVAMHALLLRNCALVPVNWFLGPSSGVCRVPINVRAHARRVLGDVSKSRYYTPVPCFRMAKTTPSLFHMEVQISAHKLQKGSRNTSSWIPHCVLHCVLLSTSVVAKEFLQTLTCAIVSCPEPRSHTPCCVINTSRILKTLTRMTEIWS